MKQAVSFVLASLGPSTYRTCTTRLLVRCGLSRAKARLGALGWAGEKNNLFDQPAGLKATALKLNKRNHSAEKHRICYCPKYHPMPYRSRKLVIIVRELA